MNPRDALAIPGTTLYIAFDTSSGSISDFRRWMQMVTEELRDLQPERTYAMTFSDRVHNVMVMEPDFVTMLPTLPIITSGGTHYDAVFDAVRRDRGLTGEVGPHRVVIISDALGATEHPPSEAEFDVVWLNPDASTIPAYYGRADSVLTE